MNSKLTKPCTYISNDIAAAILKVAFTDGVKWQIRNAISTSDDFGSHEFLYIDIPCIKLVRFENRLYRIDWFKSFCQNDKRSYDFMIRGDATGSTKTFDEICIYDGVTSLQLTEFFLTHRDFSTKPFREILNVIQDVDDEKLASEITKDFNRACEFYPHNLEKYKSDFFDRWSKSYCYN